jgi:hypothetical protein
MACAERMLVWWDRDVDQAGKLIRPDVRSAGHDIWEQACRRTQAVLADRAPAAELMENAVAQVSCYLDSIGAPLLSPKHGLLMLAFCRALRRHAAKTRRLDLVGGPGELSHRAVEGGWTAQVNARLDLENIVRQLSERNREVLMLRAAGYEWKEIALLLGTSAPAIRNAFWREIEKIRW